MSRHRSHGQVNGLVVGSIFNLQQVIDHRLIPEVVKEGC